MTLYGRYIPDVIRITGKIDRRGKIGGSQAKFEERLPPHVCKVCGKKLGDFVMYPLCPEHDDITESGRKRRKNPLSSKR